MEAAIALGQSFGCCSGFNHPDLLIASTNNYLDLKNHLHHFTNQTKPYSHNFFLSTQQQQLF